MTIERIAIGCCLLALGAAACKTREDPAPAPMPAAEPAPEPDPNAPRLPVGMLSGIEGGASPAAKEGHVRRLRSARDVSTGEWIELQPAAPGDSPRRTTFEHFRGASLFIPLDAMSLLHGAFVRAQSGFDAFVPQLLDPRSLRRLRVELAAFEKLWTATSTVKEAQERWNLSSLVRGLSSDAQWLEARAALVATIGDIVRMAEDLETKESGVWVLSAH